MGIDDDDNDAAAAAVAAAAATAAAAAVAAAAEDLPPPFPRQLLSTKLHTTARYLPNTKQGLGMRISADAEPKIPNPTLDWSGGGSLEHVHQGQEGHREENRQLQLRVQKTCGGCFKLMQRFKQCNVYKG